VAIFGSSHVRNWKRLQFPKVTILYGDPIRWAPVAEPTREQQQEVANQIFAEIKALYAQLEADGRKGVLKRMRALRREARKRPATA
jgi:1-acyl-sn-glycerol-3-phosphate acyltransferase